MQTFYEVLDMRSAEQRDSGVDKHGDETRSARPHGSPFVQTRAGGGGGGGTYGECMTRQPLISLPLPSVLIFPVY